MLHTFKMHGNKSTEINIERHTQKIIETSSFYKFGSTKQFHCSARVNSPAPGKENVWFQDSPDFENLPDFRTGRDVR